MTRIERVMRELSDLLDFQRRIERERSQRKQAENAGDAELTNTDSEAQSANERPEA